MSNSSMATLAARFDKMQLRERRLVLIAGIVGLALLIYAFGIEPAQTRAARDRAMATQQQVELASLQPQLVMLRRQAADPDAGLRKRIADTQQQLAGIDKELHAYDHLLVPPGQMPQLLHSLLSKHRGLELVQLKTLPAAPLLTTPEDTKTPANNPRLAQPVSGSKPPPPPGGIYRHAVEITVAGNYFELMRYAEELQRISPRPLWSAMELKVVEYPRSELTFTLYTLSLDLPWLAV